MWPRTNRESKVRLSAGFPTGKKKVSFPVIFQMNHLVVARHQMLRMLAPLQISTVALLPFEIIALIPLPCGWHGSNYGKRNRAAVQGYRLLSAICVLPA